MSPLACTAARHRGGCLPPACSPCCEPRCTEAASAHRSALLLAAPCCRPCRSLDAVLQYHVIGGAAINSWDLKRSQVAQTLLKGPIGKLKITKRGRHGHKVVRLYTTSGGTSKLRRRGADGQNAARCCRRRRTPTSSLPNVAAVTARVAAHVPPAACRHHRHQVTGS